jgi:hypothetical protein
MSMASYDLSMFIGIPSLPVIPPQQDSPKSTGAGASSKGFRPRKGPIKKHLPPLGGRVRV